jgi:hypothetical protein
MALLMGRIVLASFLLCWHGRGYDGRNGQEVSRIGERLMRKTYKYRLYPNQATEKQSRFVLNRCSEPEKLPVSYEVGPALALYLSFCDPRIGKQRHLTDSCRCPGMASP